MALPAIPGYYFDAEKNRWFKGSKPASRDVRVPPRITMSRAHRPGVCDPEDDVTMSLSTLEQQLMTRFTGCGNLSAALLRREVVPRGVRDYATGVPRDIYAEAWAGSLAVKGFLEFSGSGGAGDGNDDGSSQGSSNAYPYVNDIPDELDGLPISAMLVLTDLNPPASSLYAKDALVMAARGRKTGIQMRGVLTSPTACDVPAARIPNHVKDLLETTGVYNISAIKYSPEHRFVLTQGYRLASEQSVVTLLPMESLLYGPGDFYDNTYNPLNLAPYTHWSAPAGCPRYLSNAAINCVAPAHPDSPYMFAMGTSVGVAVADGKHQNTTIWLNQPPADVPRWATPSILDVCWDPDHRFIVYGGTRDGRLWMADTRTGVSNPVDIQHSGPIAHLRVLNRRGGGGSGGREILCAGPMDQMAIYDTRFTRKVETEVTRRNNRPPKVRRKNMNNRNNPILDASPWAVIPTAPRATVPVVRFSDYRNHERMDLGLDVSQSLGVVAVGHSDGTVAAYSVRTGRKLRTGELENLQGREPVRALQFARAKGDSLPSLWVGASEVVTRYTVGDPMRPVLDDWY